MNILGIEIGGTIEDKARAMDGETFFAEYYQTEEYMSLDLDTRRDITASKYGLTWEQYSSMSATDRVNLNLAKAGFTYISGIDDGVEAAQADARFGYFRGLIGGARTLGFLGLAGAGAAIFIFRKPILNAIRSGAK